MNPDEWYVFKPTLGEGIGLARLEFVINNAIGVHPKTLLNCETMEGGMRALIGAKMMGYGSPKEFSVQKIAEGVATLAATGYPKRAIVRLSDFQSNECKSLISGEQCEPDKGNPILAKLDAQGRCCFILMLLTARPR